MGTKDSDTQAELKLEVLAQLIGTLQVRRHASPKESYTAKLLSAGVHKCAKKLGEEAVELALALVDGKKKHVRCEAADLIYHFLVALMARGVPLSDVMEELQARFGLSGIEEKARRREA